MYETTTIPDIVRDSLTSLWGNVADFLPRFIGALVVFLVGWLVAVVLAKLVWHVVRAIQLDRALESVGFKTVWERSGHKLDSAYFFYELVKWFVIIGFLMIATDILGLTRVTDFLQDVVSYLPNVFIAAIILIIVVLFALLSFIFYLNRRFKYALYKFRTNAPGYTQRTEQTIKKTKTKGKEQEVVIEQIEEIIEKKE